MARPPIRCDSLLDAVALVKGHLDGDEEAMQVLLDSCDTRHVTRLLSYMLASALKHLPGMDDPDELTEGLDQLRAVAFLGGDQ